MAAPLSERSLNILLAYDGSNHALAAIDMLRDLPLSHDSQITLLGVLIPRESSNHSILEAALENGENRLKEKGFKAASELILGYPAEILLQQAEEKKPDLIIVGAKGLRATLGILLGGVAQQIVEYANQPVLVVRAPYEGLKRVLLVTDGSSHSQKAIDYLAGAEQTGEHIRCTRFPFPPETQVDIMHVLPPLPSTELLMRSWPVGPDVLPPVVVDKESEAKWLQEEEKQGQFVLEKTERLLKSCSGFKTSKILKRGDAATEILEVIKSHSTNLVIAGSRGLSEVESWLLGSVSRKLVHYASCSVLIVKGM
jgi:nucleotide-binding universal stress UspA family protein